MGDHHDHVMMEGRGGSEGSMEDPALDSTGLGSEEAVDAIWPPSKAASAEPSNKSSQAFNPQWSVMFDDTGTPMFYNKETNESTWEVPPDLTRTKALMLEDVAKAVLGTSLALMSWM